MSAFDAAPFPDRPDVDLLRASVGVATHVPDDGLLVEMALDSVRFHMGRDGRLLGDLAVSGPITTELTGEAMARWFSEINGPKLWGRWPMPAEFQKAAAELNRRGRAEHERQVVAAQHERERQRVELVEDVAVAERRAELLRELRELGDAPKVTAPVPEARPVPKRWRR